MTEIFHIFASVTRPLTQSYTGQYDGQHAKNDKRQKINDSATTEKPVGDLGRRTPPGIRRIGSYDPQRPQRTRRTEPADSDPRRSDRPPQHRGREQGGHADPQQAVFQHTRKTGDRPRRGHADRGKRHDPAGLGHHDTRNSATSTSSSGSRSSPTQSTSRPSCWATNGSISFCWEAICAERRSPRWDPSPK